MDVTKEGPRRDPGEDPSGEESPNEAGSDMDEDAEPEPADVPTRPASSVRQQPLSEPSIPGGSVPAVTPAPQLGDPRRTPGSSSRAYGPVPVQVGTPSPSTPYSHRGFYVQNRAVCGNCHDFNLHCNSTETELDCFRAEDGVGKVYLDPEFGISYFLEEGPSS